MQLETITAQSIHLLGQMIAIPSLSGEEAKVASLLESSLRLLAPHSIEKIGNNLIAVWSGKRPGPTLLLSSNLDTLPPVRGWSRHPYKPTVEDDRVYGLGATSSGASVVSMFGAIKASLPLQTGRIVLCLTAEKERGTNGFRAIESQLPRYDAGIFGVPTNMAVATEMRGMMTLSMHSRGKTSSSSATTCKRNAIDVFAADLTKIRSIDLKDDSRWGGVTIEPTAIQGGISASQIPDLVTTTLDVRTTPTKSNEWVLDQLRTLGIEFYITANPRKPTSIDHQNPLLLSIRSAYSGVATCTFNGLCDAAYASAPCVIMGPGKPERAQIADEFCTYSEIREGILVYRTTIKAFAERSDDYERESDDALPFHSNSSIAELHTTNG